MRETNRSIMPEFLTRYSTRAFTNRQPTRESVLGILEAARFAPSSGNEQPWRFVIGWKKTEIHHQIFSTLTEKNQTWNEGTSTFLVLIAKQSFTRIDKENHWANFDLGSAWGFMQIQAEHDGIATHAMAGFDGEALSRILGLSDEFKPVVVVALGYYGDPANLSEKDQLRHGPRERRSVEASILAE
ncbi:nitroreductase family protein [Gottschalkiaceae bacterium SANA]|nr:nitroreductase family protein [Gottschalkiaceae bacterium SANA]